MIKQTSPDDAPNIAASVKARRNPVISEVGESSITVTNDPVVPTNLTKTPIIEENTSDKKITNRSLTKTVWSLEDKLLFFTALKNYGKNFVEISHFMKSRSTRLNQKDGGKSKEQIRVFYIRMYNKVKQYIKFPSELPQYVQELYALINYGVFRTRIKKKLNTRLGEKLNELVNKGMTVIKSNCKRITLRTPVCPALKRLNNINTPEQESTLPDDVIIEMVPRNYITLWRVQMLEQNPRIRMKVSLNRQISDIMSLISNRFKHCTVLIRESLGLAPVNELPIMKLRLIEPRKFHREISIREILKPRFDSITLKTYCVNNTNKNSSENSTGTGSSATNYTSSNVNTNNPSNPSNANSNHLSASNHISNSNNNNQHCDDNEYTIKMDFNDIERKILDGIDLEEGRVIKLLSLYIGLGCPEKIRFEYEYLQQSDLDLGRNSVTNVLHRLIHLSKNDHLENLQQKEVKSNLDYQIAEQEMRLEQLREEIKQMECRYNDFQEPGIVLSPTKTSPFDSGVASQKNTIVYKKQHEAMQQFIEELPNKKDVVVRQLDYTKPRCSTNTSSLLSGSNSQVNCNNSSLNSMKEFNLRFRRKHRVTQKKPAFIVQMPFGNTGSSLNSSGTVVRDGGVVQSGGFVVQGSQNQYVISDPNICYQLNNQCLNPNQIISDNNYEPELEDNENSTTFLLNQNESTNDSLHSILNAVSSFTSEQQQQMQAQGQVQGQGESQFMLDDTNSLFGSDFMFGLMPSEGQISPDEQSNNI